MTKRRKAIAAFVAFLAFTLSQLGILSITAQPQRSITARLITKNNQPITVNGNSAATGTTVFTGATIETPDQVGATLDLGDAGTVEVQPNTKIQLDYDANGNVHVKVIRGCAVTRKKINALPGEMEIYTDSASEKTDKKRRHLGFCILPNGQLSAISTSGLSTAATAAVVGGITGGVITGVVIARGGNNSPTRP